MNNKEKYYQKIKKDIKSNLEDEVDILMSTDIVALQLSTKEIAFARSQSGWLFKEKRSEMVGSFLADFYCVTGLCLESKKRREHLTEEDLIENNLFSLNFSKSSDLSQSNSRELSDSMTALNGTISLDELDNKIVRRKSLPKPPKPNLTWTEYISMEKQPCIGRKMICKENIKKFKATLGMVNLYF